jgi:hypothetical protein
MATSDPRQAGDGLRRFALTESPAASYRCAGADPVVRACVIPSLSRNCIAISAQARIGSSSAHFTSIALSPCSTRKWAALEGGGGASPRGPPGGGCNACPVLFGPPGCGEGDDAAPGAGGRGPPDDGGWGGRAKAAVACSAAATPKHTVDRFNNVLSYRIEFAVAYDLKTWAIAHPCYQQPHAVRVPA